MRFDHLPLIYETHTANHKKYCKKWQQIADPFANFCTKFFVEWVVEIILLELDV